MLNKYLSAKTLAEWLSEIITHTLNPTLLRDVMQISMCSESHFPSIFISGVSGINFLRYQHQKVSFISTVDFFVNKPHQATKQHHSRFFLIRIKLWLLSMTQFNLLYISSEGSTKIKETVVTKVCRLELKCILKEEQISKYSKKISVYQQVSCIKLTQVLIKYHLITFSLQQSFLCNLESFIASSTDFFLRQQSLPFWNRFGKGVGQATEKSLTCSISSTTIVSGTWMGFYFVKHCFSLIFFKFVTGRT